MAATRGKDFLLRRSADGGATFQTVGGLRANGFTLNNEPIDVTTKDGSDWRKLLPVGGTQTLSISASGVFENGVQAKNLRADSFSKATRHYRIIDSLGNYVQAQFWIASFAETGEYKGAVEFTISLENADDVTVVEV